MNSVLLVSHSKKITDGLKEMIEEMIGIKSSVNIFSLGGTEDGRLGTDAVKILECIEENRMSDYLYIFCDIGSAILSAETAIDMLDDELKSKVILTSCPLVEGAFSTSVQLSINESKENILKELEKI